MKNYLRLISAAIAFIMLFPLIGCAGGGGDTTSADPITSAPEGPSVTDEATEAPGSTSAPEATETEKPEDTKAPDAPVDEWTDVRAKAQTEPGIKVLFIGDSLTHYNDMPQIFAALCREAGLKVTVDSLTKGGTGIAMYREDGTLWQRVSDKIASTNWDIVIYQPNRNNPVMTEFFPYYPWKEYSAAKDIVGLIKDAGAIPLQYSSFGVNKGYVTREGNTKRMTRLEHTELVTAYNAAVAEMLGSRVVYTGATFNKVIDEHPRYVMYHTDNSHPSPAGSYLVACDFFTVIFGKAPIDVEYTNGLDAEIAKTLRAASELLLTFEPTNKAVIEHIEEEKKEKGTLTFGAHSFSNVAAAGKTSVFDVSEDNSTISYTFKNGDGILYSFATLDGKPVSGNNWSFEADVAIEKYCGSKNPTAGLQLIAEDGKVYRLYLRTAGSNITGTDPSTATFHIRTDHNDSASRTDKGSFSNKVKLRLEVTPDSMCLYTDGQLYMTITYDGTEFFDGTKSTKMTYNGADVQLGLVTCYGDTSFSNVVIK
ncbi:MAG: SGNH/GDSL hydrolase family protein [Clostridia bacterium]|nr:SGNH/GDSL hydrolase family protein [Clostridia bacterium]